LTNETPALTRGIRGARDTRLDVLRGVAIVLVLAWHLQPLRRIWRLYELVWVFNRQITLLAVPVLFVVSLYLLARRVDRGPRYLMARLVRVFSLFAAYAILQVVVSTVVSRSLPAWHWSLVYMGGPVLPRVGDSVFYFLFDLLVLTALMWGYAVLPGRPRIAVGLGAILISLVWFEAAAFGLVSYIPYFSPLNFLVYVPVAYWLASGRAPVAKLWPVLTLAYIAFSIQDLILMSPFGFSLDLSNYCYYGRVSLVAGAVAAIAWTLASKHRRAPVFEVAGRYSLGLYAWHKYAWYVVAVLLAQVAFPGRAGGLEPMLEAAGALCLTILIVWLLSKSPLRWMVTEGRRSTPPAKVQSSDAEDASV
jgi:peptidoglycan/LPS O-acetylase OafA/YrhL